MQRKPALQFKNTTNDLTQVLKGLDLKKLGAARHMSVVQFDPEVLIKLEEKLRQKTDNEEDLSDEDKEQLSKLQSAKTIEMSGLMFDPFTGEPYD